MALINRQNVAFEAISRHLKMPECLPIERLHAAMRSAGANLLERVPKLVRQLVRQRRRSMRKSLPK